MISIIIPFFNAGSYLKNCVQSLLEQTYKEFELILIDDGSSDISVKDSEILKNKDARIKVIHTPHIGESNAFNIGISTASGHYVMFVSAIDWLPNANCLSTLALLSQKNKADLVVSNFFEFNNNNASTLIHLLNDKSENIYTPKQWFSYEYDHTNYMDQCFTSIYGKLFSKKLFYNIDFNNIMGELSDSFTWKLTLLANKIVYINDSLYVYRRNIKNSSSYHFEPSSLHSLPTIEERIAILTEINFNLDKELVNYVQRLKYHCNISLKNGYYYDYLNSLLKLNIINKNRRETEN